MKKFLVVLCFLLCPSISFAYDACSISSPVVPCTTGGINYDTFVGNYSTNRSFYKANSYDIDVVSGYVCLSIKSGYPHSDGYAYVANYGATVWTSPSPYNANFGIFGSIGGSCVQQADHFEWFGVGAPNQLTINLTPSAGGTIASNPGTLSCEGSVCQGSFSGNVTLTASPTESWSFGYWDDGTITSGDNPLTVSVNGDKTLNATFYPEMKMPLPGGKHWVLSVETGGQVQCNGGTDQYHTGTGYYALDFTDNTIEDGHLEGTNVAVLAAAGGTVVAASTGWSSSYGWTVVIDHGSGYKTRYAHLKSQPTISGTVVRGQQIGVMGNTPGNMGIHLHFQVYHNGDSSSTNVPVKSVRLDGRKLDDYKVDSADCLGGVYLSTNQ